MKLKKKLSKYQLGLVIAASLLIFLNEVFAWLYLSKTLTLTTYKYIFVAFSSIIIITAFILKKKADNIYRTLAIIMIGVSNLFKSLMTITVFSIFIFYFAWCLSLILLLAFIAQSVDE